MLAVLHALFAACSLGCVFSSLHAHFAACSLRRVRGAARSRVLRALQRTNPFSNLNALKGRKSSTVRRVTFFGNAQKRNALRQFQRVTFLVRYQKALR